MRKDEFEELEGKSLYSVRMSRGRPELFVEEVTMTATGCLTESSWWLRTTDKLMLNVNDIGSVVFTDPVQAWKDFRDRKELERHAADAAMTLAEFEISKLKERE